MNNKAFERVDKKDWDELYDYLGYTTHGRFWKEVFDEFRQSLPEAEGGFNSQRRSDF